MGITRAVIDISAFSAETNDRFANDESFFASAYDLSGIGRNDRVDLPQQELNGHWVTMISPNVFLSAAHYHSDVGDDVTFYTSNDPNGSYVVRALGGTQAIGGLIFFLVILIVLSHLPSQLIALPAV